jgi:hypothetical protein
VIARNDLSNGRILYIFTSSYSRVFRTILNTGRSWDDCNVVAPFLVNFTASFVDIASLFLHLEETKQRLGSH